MKRHERERKRKYRASLSDEDKEEVRRKDRERKQTKSRRNNAKFLQSAPSEQENVGRNRRESLNSENPSADTNSPYTKSSTTEKEVPATQTIVSDNFTVIQAVPGSSNTTNGWDEGDHQVTMAPLKYQADPKDIVVNAPSTSTTESNAVDQVMEGDKPNNVTLDSCNPRQILFSEDADDENFSLYLSSDEDEVIVPPIVATVVGNSNNPFTAPPIGVDKQLSLAKNSAKSGPSTLSHEMGVAKVSGGEFHFLAQSEKVLTFDNTMAKLKLTDEEVTKLLTEDSDDEKLYLLSDEDEVIALAKNFAKSGSRTLSNEMGVAKLSGGDFYFLAQSKNVVTSDNTLAKLRTPRLTNAEVTKLLRGSKLAYETEVNDKFTFYIFFYQFLSVQILELIEDHRAQFPKWLALLHRGYSIVSYGLGSKKSLLHDFHENWLVDNDCVVVNGFFPSLSIKDILNIITVEILDIEETFSSTTEQLGKIFASLTHDLYLLIHNIDGPKLRSNKVQSTLAHLASHPLVHLVCSIDHINAPLLWDQQCLSKFNFIWFDCTTFLPYLEEAGGVDNLMVKKTEEVALASLGSVWASLTPNAKKIYTIIIRYQIENMDGVEKYPGIYLMELYRICRSEFLVASDLALRAHLAEFRVHKLVKSKKGDDGGEYLLIPFNKQTLKIFLEKISEK